MNEFKPCATLIGDLVGSTRSKDRSELQWALADVLRSVNVLLEPLQPIEPTLGDEFQGAFAEPAAAVRASLLLRLELLKRAEIDSRYGIGYGVVTVFQRRAPISQDGPGWWSARAAIEQVERIAEGQHLGFVRSRFQRADETGMLERDESALNAFLISRDAVVARMRPPARRRLLGLLLGRPQGELAAEEGTTQSAISQSLARSGAYAIEAAERELMAELR
jgi:SatD family (SatD)